MKTWLTTKWKHLNSRSGALLASIAKRFPRLAKFLGIVRSRRRPVFILFLLLMHTVGFFMSIQAAMQSRTEQGTVAWVLSLNLAPVVAVPAWMVFGDSKLDDYRSVRRAGLEKVRPLADELMTHLKEAGALAAIESGNPMKTFERLASIPAIGGSKAELLVDGKNTFDSIFKAINEAEDYILVQFFILRNDGTGKELKKHLAAKAKAGVKVYVLLDDIGSMDLSESYVAELRDSGIDARFFMNFVGGANRFQLNFRNHRKIVVVDGKQAFIGGHNVGDEYLGKHPVRTPWRDSHVKLTGPIAKAAQVSFVEDWSWATGGDLLSELNWSVEKSDFKGEMNIVCLPSGPADPLETCSLFFLNAINTAKKRIWIASPYFVPDSKMIAALQLAAIRGVDVKILMPEVTDSKLVQLTSYSYLEELEKADVEIYRYTAGFLHQKVMLIDDEIATIGSANFDNRSFRLNFEVTAIIQDAEFAKSVETMLSEDFSNSEIASAAEYKERSFFFRLAVRVARMLAPIQ